MSTYEIARIQATLRSHGRCQSCGSRMWDQTHHWAREYPPEEDTVGNDLIALCKPCHDIATELRRYFGKGGDVPRLLDVFGEGAPSQELHFPLVDRIEKVKAFARSNGQCQFCGHHRASEAYPWSRLYSPDDSVKSDGLTALCTTCYEVATILRRYLLKGSKMPQMLVTFCGAIDRQTPLFDHSGVPAPPTQRTFGGPNPPPTTGARDPWTRLKLSHRRNSLSGGQTRFPFRGSLSAFRNPFGGPLRPDG